MEVREDSPRYEREFARIPVNLRALVRQLEPSQVDDLSDRIRLRASVWAPTNEGGLQELASRQSGSAEGLLAHAILELTGQIVRLQSRIMGQNESMIAVEVTELSGGGGRIETPLPLEPGDFLELLFEDEINDIPPIRAVIQIKHRYGKPTESLGFSLHAIHPYDEELLIRLIYQLQREFLRRSHEE